MFNAYIEDVLIANGINVVIVAHTVFDEASGRHIIPASGAFAKSGSWLSVVNESVFVLKQGGKLTVYQQSLKYPARSTLSDIEEKVPVEKYDINEHIKKLVNTKVEAEEFRL